MLLTVRALPEERVQLGATPERIKQKNNKINKERNLKKQEEKKISKERREKQ